VNKDNLSLHAKMLISKLKHSLWN